MPGSLVEVKRRSGYRLSQPQAKFRPIVLRLGQSQVPTVGSSQLSRDAQAQSVTWDLLIASGAIEALENVRSTVGRNSRAAVTDANTHLFARFRRRQQDPAPRPIILYRVLHQVLKNERNHVAVSSDRQRFRKLGLNAEVALLAQDVCIFHAALE